MPQTFLVSVEIEATYNLPYTFILQEYKYKKKQLLLKTTNFKKHNIMSIY